MFWTFLFVSLFLIALLSEEKQLKIVWISSENLGF